VFDTIIQLAVQNPELTALLIIGVGAVWSWNRSPIPVPGIPGLHLFGLALLIGSAFYFFAVPSPAGPVERGFRFVGDAMFSLILFAYIIRKTVDI